MSPEGVLPLAIGPSEASPPATLAGTTEAVAQHHTPPVEGEGPAQPPPPLTPPPQSSPSQHQQVSERLLNTETHGGTPPLPLDTSPSVTAGAALDTRSCSALTAACDSGGGLAPKPFQLMQSSTLLQARPLTLPQALPVIPIQTPSPTTSPVPPPIMLSVLSPAYLPVPSLTRLTGSSPTPPSLLPLARTPTMETGVEIVPAAASTQSPLRPSSPTQPIPQRAGGE